MRPSRATRSRFTWPLKGLLTAFCLTLMLSACTPAQLVAFLDEVGYDHSSWTEEETAANAAYISEWFEWYFDSIDIREFDKFYDSLSEAQLHRLRMCESGGDYNAIGGRGAFRGAYQFTRSTWNAIASAYYPSLVGVDPAGAPTAVQDAMARALFAQQGRRPWPVCGNRM